MTLDTILNELPDRALPLLRRDNMDPDEVLRVLCVCYAMLPSSPSSADPRPSPQLRLDFHKRFVELGMVRWDLLLAARTRQHFEPWSVHVSEGGCVIELENQGGACVARIGSGDPDFCPQDLADARRIVQCVNAMEGVADPAQLRARVDALAGDLKDMTSRYSHLEQLYFRATVSAETPETNGTIAAATKLLNP